VESETALLITDVEEGSPAGEGGIVVGDFLVRLGGRPVFDTESLLAALVGQNERSVDVDVLRGGRRQTIQVTPAARVRRPSRRMRRRSSGRGNAQG
jgi:regulator of sigma E protease